MNDRFLSKAKRVDNGEWVVGQCISLDDCVIIKPVEYPYCDMDETWDNGDSYFEIGGFKIRTDTLCQCTGTIINDDEKVFEGDIIERTYTNPMTGKVISDTYVVEWTTNGYMLENQGGRCLSTSFREFDKTVMNYRIIGNIHDKETP